MATGPRLVAGGGIAVGDYIYTSGTKVNCAVNDDDLNHTPAEFYTLRLLTGAAEAGFFPGVVLYLSQWFPTFRRGRIMALFMSAIPVSGLLGSPFSGWILNHFAAGQGGLAGTHHRCGASRRQWQRHPAL